jgi:hypothetical protein
VIDAVGYVAGNAVVFVAGLAGLFIGMCGVHNSKNPFRLKNL